MSHEANYSDAPNSPLHPGADQEVPGLPESSLPGSVMDLLDLNPDLEARALTPEPVNVQKSIEEVVGDRIEDFQPTVVPSPINAAQLQAVHSGRRLSSSQQSKFVNYVDEKLLHIQRRFVQSFGLSDLGYKKIDELLADVKQLLNFVWLSIDSNNQTQLSKEQYREMKSTNFGQTDYIIRIAGDLLEYISKLDIDDESAQTILKLLSSLDTKFAKLIDGEVPGGKGISRTESVRVNGIAERTRITVADVFEKQKIEGFHYELSKIYDQVLDRTA